MLIRYFTPNEVKDLTIEQAISKLELRKVDNFMKYWLHIMQLETEPVIEAGPSKL